MPLLHMPDRTLRAGDLLVCSDPCSRPGDGSVRDIIYEEWDIQTKISLSKVHRKQGKYGLVSKGHAGITITPYMGGGFRLVNTYHSLEETAYLINGHPLGVVRGHLDWEDPYVALKFLKRVVKKYHTAIYEQCFSMFKKSQYTWSHVR
jgi:hypothetical protein